MFTASYTHPHGPSQARRHMYRTGARITIRNYLGEDVVIAAPGSNNVSGIEVVQDWVRFVRAFDAAIMAGDALQLVSLLSQFVPRAQFVRPEVEAKLLDRSFQFRDTVANLYFRHDMSDITVLVMFYKRTGQRAVAVKVQGPQYPTARHLTGAWWGFSDIDEAVLAKMSSDLHSEIIEVA